MHFLHIRVVQFDFRAQSILLDGCEPEHVGGCTAGLSVFVNGGDRGRAPPDLPQGRPARAGCGWRPHPHPSDPLPQVSYDGELRKHPQLEADLSAVRELYGPHAVSLR